MELLLKKYFGYDSFRPMQLDVINNVLDRNDSLVLMPTGGGKSVCYQIPALKFDGLTIIISPLISLMKDQVDNLKANGISAESINSTLNNHEIEKILYRIKRNDVKILYISPERLALEGFRNFLMSVNVSLIAIDEAHCISEWGHDFRREYRNLKSLKTNFPNVPIIALTATATLKVREDILKQLNLNNPKIFASSFDRDNLNLIVMPKKNTFDKILTLLDKHKDKAVIIYCFSRKDTEDISRQLNKDGYKSLPYHAGLSPKIRKENQDLFIRDKVNIIVATIAFGMGIDKPDVRLIIHHTFSKTVEGYYQEIGRAGRDNLPSDCVLFFSYGDKYKHDYFIRKIEDAVVKDSAIEKLDKMIFYAQGSMCRRKYILNYFGEEYQKENCNSCDICLELPDIASTGSKKMSSRKRVKKGLEYDSILFDELRILRKEIAQEKNVPPFVIFGDVSLQEMCTYYPMNYEEFLEINGVGEQKLRDYADLFLERISYYVQNNNIDKKKHKFKSKKIVKKKNKKTIGGLSSKQEIIKDMILKKMSVSEMAQIQKITEGTIVNYIEKVAQDDKSIDVSYLLSSQKDYEIIKDAFEKFGLERLKPVYDYFDGSYSYDELRIVRMNIDRE
jgi:ATP-dependent DNA helicase RecQ